MLARLPLGYLLLMATFATSLLCLAVDRWMRERKATAAFVIMSVVCCLGMVVVGALQAEHWNVRQMLVCYSFAWLGLTIGLFPARKLFREFADEWRRGVRRDEYKLPVRYRVAPVVSVTVSGFLAYALAG
ncbi:hypothetical protein [Actinomadura terrae]|uniref:hypothetical protein n=1 Tax=Actinomadura terrae TaxID=604353 RepID=UPI001FA7461F|nr:hypothetical protein [Actinomadura terrae]